MRRRPGAISVTLAALSRVRRESRMTRPSRHAVGRSSARASSGADAANNARGAAARPLRADSDGDAVVVSVPIHHTRQTRRLRGAFVASFPRRNRPPVVTAQRRHHVYLLRIIGSIMDLLAALYGDDTTPDPISCRRRFPCIETSVFLICRSTSSVHGSAGHSRAYIRGYIDRPFDGASSLSATGLRGIHQTRNALSDFRHM
jgi:hypothetical protein